MFDSFRQAKAKKIRDQGKFPYAALFERSATLKEAKAAADDSQHKLAGRVVLKRDMGKLTFMTLQDHTGRLQIALRQEAVGSELYNEALELIDLGDHIGIEGTRFTTQKGEPTVQVSTWTMLSKALKQPPEKWHGIADQETAWRQRYLDTMSNRESFERFTMRSNFVRALREFYWEQGFLEMEAPVLVNAASGALASPFTTHHNAYDMDVFLRIAPETFLKECLVGGFDKVFEVARVFRNEGVDPSHLQDFTMVEHYSAYWDYKKNMEFTEKMFAHILQKIHGSMQIKIPDREGNLVEADFTPPWPRITIRDAILQACGIDFFAEKTADALRSAMKRQGIHLDVSVDQLGFGNLVDQLYKKVSRPSIVHPTFIIEHPIELSPLARRNDANPQITDRFQLVVSGWEIVNAYSELVDPEDQLQRFEEQAQAHAGGDSDAHDKDDEYVEALAYGCPPCSGWGMGIDRVVTLLTQQQNLRDVVLFPLMKPLDANQQLSTNPEARKQENQKPVTSNQQPSKPPTLSLPLQSAEYGHLLPAAHALLEAHVTNTKAHLIATGAAMEALAKKYSGDAHTWRIAGMLHDLDWDSLDKNWEKHCGDELAAMLGTMNPPPELLADIRSHYAERYGSEHPLDTLLRTCLYCCDELTGFIIAVTKVRPSKKIADVEVSSVMKKMKDKTFAAPVNREHLKACETMLNIPVEEFVGIVLQAMQGVASELGL